MGISPSREIGFVLQESPRQLEGARGPEVLLDVSRAGEVRVEASTRLSNHNAR